MFCSKIYGQKYLILLLVFWMSEKQAAKALDFSETIMNKVLFLNFFRTFSQCGIVPATAWMTWSNGVQFNRNIKCNLTLVHSAHLSLSLNSSGSHAFFINCFLAYADGYKVIDTKCSIHYLYKVCEREFVFVLIWGIARTISGLQLLQNIALDILKKI